MTRRDDFAGLVRLTAAAFDAAQARLAGLRRREAELREMMAALESDRRRGPRSESELDPARRAGADLLWQRWVDGRQTALNLEMARHRAVIAQAREDLKPVFGRREAARRLFEADRAARRRAALRRPDGQCR